MISDRNRPTLSPTPQKISVALPFDNSSSTAEYHRERVPIGNVSRIDVVGLSTDYSTTNQVWIDFKGFGHGIHTGTVKKFDGMSTTLQGKWPIPINMGASTAGPLTIASFKENRSMVENQLQLTFYNPSGALITHTGVLYLDVYTFEPVDL